MNKKAFKDIPVVILAGGQGTRLREQTEFMPKPMVPVGTKPILWHIMKIYSYYGFKRFVICLGYKGDTIKDYFLNYRFRNSDFTINLSKHNDIIFNQSHEMDDWQVTLADTGMKAMTGSRIKQIEKYTDTDCFLLTYGDGVADVEIDKLMEFHLSHGKIATVTGVRPPSRFGELRMEENRVVEFGEKPQIDSEMINGGFFVLNREVFSYLRKDNECTFEREPMEKLAEDGQLMVYHHTGFWQCMDTLRDMDLLNKYWENDDAPWKIWE